MSTTTMLQLVQQVTNELGVPTPNSVAGNPNQDIIQIQALMNASGYELMSEVNWRELTRPHSFYTTYVTTTGDYTANSLVITNIPDTTGLDETYMVVGTGFPNATFISSVDSSTQVTVTQASPQTVTGGTIYFQKVKYDMPADYESTVPRTHWDKSKHWEMLGPCDPQQWEWLLSGFISTGPRVRWRLYGEYFQIWPGFSNNEYLGFEYRSKGWARAANGTVKNSFTVDTDTCVYPDRLMVLKTKLKYFEAKGFPTQAMYQDYTRILETYAAQSTSAANLSFAPGLQNILIGWDNIPDSGYGQG